MNAQLALAALAALCLAVSAKNSPPKVQVYSRDPGQFGAKNTLICHVNEFHPPDITIELLKGDEVLPDATQTDLAFKQDWRFHLTKSASFTPEAGQTYACRVTHSGVTKIHKWENNM